MKIRVIKNDITKVKNQDAVVNTANPYPVIGAGTDSAIYKAAGEENLLVERLKIGNIEPGDARVTSGYDLSRYIIHTVEPVYIDGNHNEEKILKKCYRNSLKRAKENQCKTIVFPLISAGTYGFPLEDAVSIAISEINDFLIKSAYHIEVTIAVLNNDAFLLLDKITSDTEEVLTLEEAKKIQEEEYSKEVLEYFKQRKKNRRAKSTAEKEDVIVLSDDRKTFIDMIFYYMNIRNEKASTVYKGVELDKRQFSKIISGERKPSRRDAIKLCIGLRLTLKESYDLMSRAGYVFNPSVPEEMMIKEGIRKGKSYTEIKNDLKNNGFNPEEWM